MIFCVEDDTSIREIEVYTLKSAGYEAEGFSDGQEFFASLDKTLPDLIILDVMLPGEDGVSILKKLKKAGRTSQIPVIMATAKGAEYDKVQSLDLGADDYLVKPFGMMEMLSRVKAVLRRVKKEEDKVIALSGITISPETHRVYANGKEVVLTMKEFELLYALMSYPGIAFSRERLLAEVWELSYESETRTVDAHIKTLRQKLGEAGEAIETIRGLGYRFKI